MNEPTNELLRSRPKAAWRRIVIVISYAAIACILAPAAAGTGAETPQRPLLLELFTSQGCSSCPPADAVLRELASRQDLLALAFHVDYWNNSDWVDSFSSAAFTSRQQAYAAVRGFEVYTPQLVVDGAGDVVGSRRAEVYSSIALAQREAKKSAPSSIQRRDSDVNIAIGTIGSAGAIAAANVYLLSFDSRDQVRIGGGENAGRNMVYSNVVRSMRKVGEWHGQAMNLKEHLQAGERGDRLAVVVQDRAGAVWAVASTSSVTASVE